MAMMKEMLLGFAEKKELAYEAIERVYNEEQFMREFDEWLQNTHEEIH